MTISDYMQLPVFQKALLVSVLAGATFSLLGIVIVMLNLTTIRFALMHMALFGGAVGLVLGGTSLAGATAGIVVCSLLLGPMSRRLRLEPGLIGAFFMTGSIAAAFLLFYIAGIPAMDVFGMFAGSILTLTEVDVVAIAGLSLVILLVYVFFYRELQLLLYDHEQAEWLGIPVEKIKYGIKFLTGLCIGLAMKIVGAFMIDAVILLPAMAALRIGRSFLQLLILSSVFGAATTCGGLLLSMVFDFPTGATITLVGVALLGATLTVRR
ncbi:metal ABC transporter permease [Paenibacillus thalictri]|uniref:Metal ABC transporter permease n=1 Tax=Paenibacillus thalictri TaxID=2527873 RepID=A0A4Q9E0P0_9BACL|nr:metal ABC transporter permease [Paenibacillus thalictri]TBL81111.1 metal ABC transporter permease [Paenibacillus thalictri]